MDDTVSSRTMPRLRTLDSTRALFADPYRFISTQCRALDTDVFATRILLEPTICMTGAEAAQVFYDPERLQRAGAAPEPLQATLFGKGAVQGMDGAPHLTRKAMFMEVLAPASVDALAEHVRQQWHAAAARWPRDRPLSLYAQAHEVLARAACQWAGVPWADADAQARTRDLVVLFDGAARLPGPHVQARLARRRLERVFARLVEQVRSGQQPALPGSALDCVAGHREADGSLLPPRIAAVELLNLIRPTVAVSVYIVFAALALYRHPEVREQLRAGGPEYMDGFLHEVRRYFPFFPAVAARVRQSFRWRGYDFPQGRRVLLDLYGTNHDPRIWDEPQRFEPLRFVGRVPDAYEFIPQGGATAAGHHRCPGEGVATALMRVTVDFLNGYDCAIEPGADEIDMARLPALPSKGLSLVLRRA